MTEPAARAAASARPRPASPRDEGAVIGFGIASVVFLFGVFVVLVLADRSDSPRALAFLAIPVAGLALSVLLFVREVRTPASRR